MKKYSTQDLRRISGVIYARLVFTWKNDFKSYHFWESNYDFGKTITIGLFFGKTITFL